MNTEVLKTLAVMAVVYGRSDFNEDAARMIATDLERYPAPLVLDALGRCRAELRTFPAVADIIVRIQDGRPGVEEAWALIPKNEDDSVIWNDEIAEAYGACLDLVDEDEVAARMAFKEVYSRIILENRRTSKPINWYASFGRDKTGRQAAVITAVSKGRITAQEAQRLVPEITDEKNLMSLEKLTGGAKLLQEMPRIGE